MAVITPGQIQLLYNQGGTDLVALFALRNVQSGDTMDMASAGESPAFSFIRKAVVMSFTANLASIAGSSGTVITLPAGLPPNSSTYLFVGGC